MLFIIRSLFFLIFSSLLLSSLSYSQSFLPATLITKQGDTLAGYVRSDYTHSFVRFKRSLSTAEAPSTYNISSINGLIINELIYERKILNNEAFLMQKLVSGAASLFVLRKNWKDRFFLEKGSMFVELIHQSTSKTLDGRMYVETYKNHLALFSKVLNDCNEFNNQQWPIGFNEKSFIALISSYNQCVQKANLAHTQSRVYPTSKRFPAHWLVNFGGGSLAEPSEKVKSSLDYYQQYTTSDPFAYIRLYDVNSKPLVNRLFMASFGFEQTRYASNNSWGILANYSTIHYKHSIQTQGSYTYDPNPYKFTSLTGDVRDLAPSLDNQPLRFEGESEEKANVIQADFFLRHYWIRDKSKFYFGFGAGYGITSSTFQAPVKIYFSDGSYQGIAVRDAQPVTSVRGGIDVMAQAGWAYFIQKNGQSMGLSIQYNSLQAHRMALLLTYAF